MKVLYYDCFSGISGDMNLAAMTDLGMPPEYLRKELEKLPLEGYEVLVERDSRHGITGTRVTVQPTRKETAHRHLKDIESILQRSTLSKPVTSISLNIFHEIAKAEAKVHGIPIDQVHFHEVGAVDSIVDIVGAAIAFDYFGAEAVLSSPVVTGKGFVTCAHGTLPVPAPATAEILKDMPHIAGKVDFEATTPTGAAVLKGIKATFPEDPELKILATGYGIGHKINEKLPNLLRVYMAEWLPGAGHSHTSLLVEANLDDMNPEWYETVMEKLFSTGAGDVFLKPVQMKKNRPAVILSVICTKAQLPAVQKVLFTETTTLGIRIIPFEKITLERKQKEYSTPWGRIRVKEGWYDGHRVSSKPEYEDCRILAEKHDMPVKEVFSKLQGYLTDREKE